MRFQLPDGKVVGIDQPFSLNGTNYGAGWLRQMTPTQRAAFGAVEVAEPPPHDQRFFYGPDQPKPLAAIRADLKRTLEGIRYGHEVRGALWGAQPVWTDRDSRASLTSLVLAVQLGARVDGSVYKFPDGPKPLANADVVPMAAAILGHVQACFDREAELIEEIDDAADLAALQAVDLTVGWPA